MQALIAGTDGLPRLIYERRAAQGEAPVLCAGPGVRLDWGPPALEIKVERLAEVLADLRGQGVTTLCMAGRVERPTLDPSAITPASAPLVQRLAQAMGLGDDGTLRTIIAIFEEAGFAVVGASEVLPDLLPPTGLLAGPRVTQAQKDDAKLGQATVAAMGARDQGQACVIRGGQVLAEEGPEGTDGMLSGLAPQGAEGGLFFKAPKPNQDRRADLPLIGPHTVTAAAEAGLTAIVIEAGGVMVLDRPQVTALCQARGVTLWVREAGA